MSETLGASGPVEPEMGIGDLVVAPNAVAQQREPGDLNGFFVGPEDAPDRYALLGTGIRGGEGITWEAQYRGDLTHPVKVAVKQILRPVDAHLLWSTSLDIDRWRDQYHLLHAIPSRHVVRVREFFVGEGPHPPSGQRQPEARFALPYLVMEFVPGPTLQAAVRDGADLTTLVGAVCELADAVTSLHSATCTAGNPMLHRDVKPSNCILHPERGLVLVDLGTLRRFDEGEDPRRPHSAHYTAPEVMRDLSAPRSAASDLYGIGAVLYFCMTGQDPPDPTEPHAVETMSRELEAAARRHGVRPARALAEPVLAMLNPDPAARPTRAIVWADGVRDLVVGSLRRRRLRGVAVAVTVVLGVGALIGYPQLDRSEPSADSSVEQPTPVVEPLAFTVFGASFTSFPAEVDGDRLTITPPLGLDRYDHLWGFYDATAHCAVDVEFDARVGDGDRGNGFGLAVAPRSVLDGDQPYGSSIQYEWTPAYVIEQPGTYIRPAELPGGAWQATVDPVAAPDIAVPHHVRVRAVGTSIEMTVDGTVARYTIPTTECGGVAIRAWGAPVEMTNIRIAGT